MQFVLTRFLQDPNTKKKFNMRELIKEMACERKWGWICERLGVLSDNKSDPREGEMEGQLVDFHAC